MSLASRWLASLLCLAAYGQADAQVTAMPATTSFKVGDKWEWRRVDSRSKLQDQQRTRAVVNVEGDLQFLDGTKNVKIADQFINSAYDPSSKPWRAWPLEVGRKWIFDSTWRRPDGVTGTVTQDVEVVAFEEVAVPAGKFMAYRIEHRGTYRSSQGNSGKQNDTFWFAPDALADVKQVRDDGYNMYTVEMTSFTRGAP
jgi:hypothetical protein